MAIERGKLGDLLLDNTEGAGLRALARVVPVLEKTPLPKAIVAVEPLKLKSALLRAVIHGARATAGQSASLI